MKAVRTIPLLALLAACSSWPQGSYVSVTDSDARVLAPDIANFVSRTLPSGSYVNLEGAGKSDPIAAELAVDLRTSGVNEAPAGHRLQYVAAPMQDGVFLRISIDGTHGGSRFYSREGGRLHAAGPMMVAAQ
jgi:hypothetical protein